MKRRGNGEGTIYGYRGGFQAQLTVPTSTGGSKRLTSPRCLRHKDAQHWLQQHQTELRLYGPTAGGPTPTVAAYGQQWISDTLQAAVDLGHLSPNTRAQYRQIFDRHIGPDLGRYPLDQLNRAILEGWLASKTRAVSARGGPHSPRGINYIYSVLRRALNDAVDHELITRNPLSNVKPPRVPRSHHQALSVAEAQAMLRCAHNERLQALWVVLLGLGLRIGEALALRWSDVDLDARTLVVARSVGRVQGELDPVTGKYRSSLVFKGVKVHGTEAVMALPDLVSDALRRHATAQRAERIAARYWQQNDLVFCTDTGTVLDSGNTLDIFKKLCRRAGITRNVRQHDLRHTTASFLLAQRIDIKVVQSVLRHTRLGTTADIYAHVLPEVTRGAANAMDEMLRRVSRP